VDNCEHSRTSQNLGKLANYLAEYNIHQLKLFQDKVFKEDHLQLLVGDDYLSRALQSLRKVFDRLKCKYVKNICMIRKYISLLLLQKSLHLKLISFHVVNS